MSAHILWLALQYITLSTMNYRKYKQLICLNWYVYIFYDGFEWAYPVRIRTVRFSCQDLNKRRKHSNDVTFIAFLFIYLFIYLDQLNVGNMVFKIYTVFAEFWVKKCSMWWSYGKRRAVRRGLSTGVADGL